jgi:hypothetical protein
MLRAHSLRAAGATFLFLAVASPAAAAGAQGPAQATAAAESGGSTAAQPKKERKICKTLELTESRMGSPRVCKTAAQWRDDQQNGNGLDDLKHSGGKAH